MRKSCLFTCVAAVILAGILQFVPHAVSAPPAGKKPPREPKSKPPKPAEGDEQPPAEGAAGRLLTKKEINRIRFMELRTLRENQVAPDKALGRIPRDVEQDFLRDMQGHEADTNSDTGAEPEWQGADWFRKQSVVMKLALIARFSEDRYADRIELHSDPEVFTVFKAKVLPIVMNNCATSRCHGGPEGAKTGLRLYNDPRKTPQTVYTNFLLLDETQINLGKDDEARRYHMFDRGRQENSLLLAWLMAADQLPPSVPRHPGAARLKTPFRSKEDNNYQAVADWIGSLRKPHPQYGVTLRPNRNPASAPAEPVEEPTNR